METTKNHRPYLILILLLILTVLILNVFKCSGQWAYPSHSLNQYNVDSVWNIEDNLYDDIYILRITEAVKYRLIEILNEYEHDCINDSTGFLVGYELFEADTILSVNHDTIWHNYITKRIPIYKYIHKEPTLVDFIKWLNNEKKY